MSLCDVASGNIFTPIVCNIRDTEVLSCSEEGGRRGRGRYSLVTLIERQWPYIALISAREDIDDFFLMYDRQHQLYCLAAYIYDERERVTCQALSLPGDLCPIPYYF